MIEMRSARQGEQAREKALWQLVFGDGDAVIDCFYRTCYQPENMLVLLEDGVLKTMMSLLPLTLVGRAGDQAVAHYVYALATDPAARKKGFARMLLHYADTYLRGRGADGLTVVPATPSLHQFFGTAGFGACFSTREAVLLHRQLDPNPGDASAHPAEPGEYLRIREALLAGTRHVAYDADLIALQQGFSRLNAADLFRLERSGAVGCAAAEYTAGDTVLVKELLMPQAQISQALAALALKLPAQRYIVRGPAAQAGFSGGCLQPFGMIKWYHRDKESAWSSEDRKSVV